MLIYKSLYEVCITLNNVRVGTADFLKDDHEHNGMCHCQNIEVAPEHVRKGIGNATYILAEIMLKTTMYNHWEECSIQSEAAKRLWSQPNRPFGNENRAWSIIST